VDFFTCPWLPEASLLFGPTLALSRQTSWGRDPGVVMTTPGWISDPWFAVTAIIILILILILILRTFDTPDHISSDRIWSRL